MAIGQQQGKALSLPGAKRLLPIIHQLGIYAENGELAGQQGAVDGVIVSHQHPALQLVSQGLHRLDCALPRQLATGLQQQIGIERGLAQSPPGIRAHAATQRLL
ncbi:hypothetical protein D3C79_610020 [compost metagenome]